MMTKDVTQLLDLVNLGESSAWNDLLPIVYQELRNLAAAKLAREQPGRTLQPTALVNEAYVRLVAGDKPATWENRRHFFSAAAEAMRRVLIDAARRRLAEKRGGGGHRESIDLASFEGPTGSDELIALNEALDRLQEVRPQVAELVKLRYFAGFTGKQAAECLGVSPRTADNYWVYAKAFLLKEMEPA